MRKGVLVFFLLLTSFFIRCGGGFLTQVKAQFNSGRDSIVRLIDAKAAMLEEIDGSPYRMVKGPAKFLHNNTYLLCDSAVWNVNNNVINAIGHVQIIQQDTYLVSDKLTYYSLDNLAEFRGDIVRLYNKKGDQLKTRYLDYHTNDSTAVFYNGGAMRSKDGQIIEGSNGKYEAATRSFSFEGDVEMFADSIFVIADRGMYDSYKERAYFYDRITAWKERDTLYSNVAMFENATQSLHLTKDNYIATENQQVWADHIKYYRSSGNAELFNNIQIQDEQQKILLLGEVGNYQREPLVATLTQNPVAALYSVEEVRHQIKDSLGVVIRDTIEIKRDTLFSKGDTLRMWQLPKYQVDENEISNAKKRLSLLNLDPMSDIHSNNKKYLDAYYRNKELIGKPKPPVNLYGQQEEGQKSESDKSDKEKSDIGSKTKVNENENVGNTEANKDEGKKGEVNESVRSKTEVGDDEENRGGMAADSVANSTTIDSTMVTFLTMYNKVKMYRADVSGACDSLVYSSLDSIARFYTDPILWNEKTNQFTADSIQVSLKNNALFKANLIDNAMIITQEDSIHFNQIKSVEMVAYFGDNDIYRFDALGGVQAMLFFRERDSSVTLMNQKECKLLSAKIKNREIQRIQYVGDIKSDMIPTYNLDIEKQRLRGFNWRNDEMPQDRYVITDKEVRASERGTLTEIRFPIYPQTKIYYPDDFKKISSLKSSIDEKIENENRERLERERANKDNKDRDNGNDNKELENSKDTHGVERMREGTDVVMENEH